MSASHFRTGHEERMIFALDDILRLKRLRETRPAGAGVILILRREERFARDNIDVDPFRMIIGIRISERRLRPLMLRYFKLLRGKFTSQFLFRRLPEGAPIPV